MTIDFFGRKLNTYRANLHTHSTLSDGEFTPNQVTAQGRYAWSNPVAIP